VEPLANAVRSKRFHFGLRMINVPSRACKHTQGVHTSFANAEIGSDFALTRFDRLAGVVL
jgi:hypothetical protein